jgi:predicted DNA-binding protein
VGEPESDPNVEKEMAAAMERARAAVADMKARAAKALKDRQQEAKEAEKAKVVTLQPKAKTIEEKVEEIIAGAGAKKAEGPVLMPKIEARRAEPAFFDEKDLTRVPGVVGRVIDWIEAASLYPNRPIALGTSLVVVGTLMGQRVAGPTQGSTHLYIVGLSPSGTNKQQTIDSGKEAFSTILATECIGPGDFRSSVALVNALKARSVFCSFVDEYGLVLQRIGDKRGGGFEYDFLSVLQQLWGHNWAFYNTPASAREKSKRVFAPSISIFGLSVPQQFYEAITFKQISGGLLNRHLILRGIERPLLQIRADGSWRLPEALKEELKEFYRPRPKPKAEEILEKDLEEMDDWSFEPEVRMGWGVGAERIWIDLVNRLREERDPLRSNLFARVPEMMVRIATIIAFGRYSTTVDELDMKFARALALQSAESLHEDALKYMVDPQGFASLCQKILERTTARKDKFISFRDLKRECRILINKPGDLDAALKHLVEEERLRQVVRQNPKGGKPSPGYALCEE